MSVVVLVDPHRRSAFPALLEMITSKFPPELRLRVTIDVVEAPPKRQFVYTPEHGLTYVED